MKKHTALTRSRWLFVCLLSLLMTLTGAGTAWADGKALPYSYGFENNDLAAEGWTTANANSNTRINTAEHRTGANCFQFLSNDTPDTPPQHLISPELSAPANATNVKVSFYYKARGSAFSESFKVGYSTTDNSTASFTWSDELVTNNTTYTQYPTATFPVETKYIAIAYTSNGRLGLFIDDIDITCDYSTPVLRVYDGETVISTGYSYNFGLETAGTAKTFTLSNPGSQAAPISVTHIGNFGVAVSGNATSIPAGGNVTLTVTMAETTGSDVITISSTSDAISDFVINVSGTIRDLNKVYLDFSDGKNPDGWTSVAVGAYASFRADYSWTASTGCISESGINDSYAWAFTSPRMTFAKGELISLETSRYATSDYSTPTITVEYSLDGTSWTAIGSAFTDDVYGTWKKRTLFIPVEGVKYIRFNGWYINLRNIYGGEVVDLTLDETSSDAVVAGTYKHLELKRTFTAGWNTVCLPFTISDVEGFFGTGAKAYDFTSYSEGALGFTAVSTLTASNPYIVYVPNAITEDIVLHDITIASGDATASSRSQGDAYFRGSYAPMAAGTLTGNYGVTSAGKIQKAGSGASLKGFRAYFDLPAAAAHPLSFYDETTGITRVADASELMNNGKVYNLNGQQVENAKKGVYIVNGKKFVIK